MSITCRDKKKEISLVYNNTTNRNMEKNLNLCNVPNGCARTLITSDMRHWFHGILVVFFIVILVSYSGVSHGTNYTHYTR